jgi:hypothetical protein
MLLVRLFEEWENTPGVNRDQWCWKNMVQSRALKQAKNIMEQLQDYMRQVDWAKLEDEIKEFRDLSQARRQIRKVLEAQRQDELL